MKPRLKPLLAPSGNSRYWTVDAPGKGPHVFRAPYYGVGACLLEAMSKHARDPEEEDTRSLQVKSMDILPVAGMVLGACWYHSGHELETVLDLKNLTPASLEDYGVAVAEELQEAGYNILDILDLFGKVTPELSNRQSILLMAQARASFTEALVDA